MNSLKFTKEHIKWTRARKKLSSLFVRLSEESLGYDWDKSKNKYVPNVMYMVQKCFHFIVTGKKLFGVKMQMVIQLLGKNGEQTIY